MMIMMPPLVYGQVCGSTLRPACVCGKVAGSALSRQGTEGKHHVHTLKGTWHPPHMRVCCTVECCPRIVGYLNSDKPVLTTREIRQSYHWCTSTGNVKPFGIFTFELQDFIAVLIRRISHAKHWTIHLHHASAVS